MDKKSFEKKLAKLDGQSYHLYKELLQLNVSYPGYSIVFKHIQGSPGANPASLCQVHITTDDFQEVYKTHLSQARLIAAEDYILRQFNYAVELIAKQNRGIEGSGSFQTFFMPQQVLKRNVVNIASNKMSILFRISLPCSTEKKIAQKETMAMLNTELPQIIAFLKEQIVAKMPEEKSFRYHCDCVEDMLTLQENLEQYGLIAFVADGSLLARESGVSDLPSSFESVPFKTPENLAVTVELPNAGIVRGFGIQPGISTIIGGGYHGKSTLLKALEKAIYPHIPGDGREQVAINKKCVSLCAEPGRAVRNLDISSFFTSLPQGARPQHYHTDNASGSTSEASSLVEFVQAGATLLLIDEDSSAANFLYRDANLQKLVPEDPIIPFFDRVQALYECYQVSTLIIASGSSSYFAVSDHVIAMSNYLPIDMTSRAKALKNESIQACKTPLSIADNRVLCEQNFDPEYFNKRLRKSIPIRIKALRGQECEIIEYGMNQIDLRYLTGIVDPQQLISIGHLLLLAKQLKLHKKGYSPTELAQKLIDISNEKGLENLLSDGIEPTFFTQVNVLQMAGALNRLRSLNVDF
ncbi:MAG: ABC-ATPase domain-containing protein [Gammaproteobacteria bacterium]|nr:ABC-ATPase domain-containing protein [Gammaproteobacteria bacterium]